MSGETASDLVRITQTGAGNALVVEDSANPDSTPFVIDASGNVGIGKTPTVKLDVSGQGLFSDTVTVNRLHVNNASSDAVLEFQNAGTRKSYLRDAGTGLLIVEEAANQPITLSTAGTERMRIASDGKVGIGSTSPSGLLTVNAGNVHVTGEGSFPSTGYGIEIVSGSTNCRWQTYNRNTSSWIKSTLSVEVLAIENGGTERMRIDTAGLITGTGTSLGAWTSYTPTLGGTGWALGNGTVAGAYCQIGKILVFRANITFGSTSTYGSTALTVSLPVTALGGNGAYALDGRATDASTGNVYFMPLSYTNTTTITVNALSSAAGLVAAAISTVPFTWATSDNLKISGIYEIA